MTKALVVDDDDIIRMFIKQALEMKQFEVVEADDGDTAIEMIRTHPDIGLLILDLKMPRMNGKEAYRVIQQMRPNIKCVVSSGYLSEEEMAELAAMGIKIFLQKPYNYEDLYRAISDLGESSGETDVTNS